MQECSKKKNSSFCKKYSDDSMCMIKKSIFQLKWIFGGLRFQLL